MVIISTTILVKSDSTFPLSYISVGIFFVNASQAKSYILISQNVAFSYILSGKMPSMLYF